MFKSKLKAPCNENSHYISYLTGVTCVLLSWTLLYILIPNEIKPGAQLFWLCTLLVLSYFCGWLVSLAHLPPLVGMLLCGIGLRNAGFFDMKGPYEEIVHTIREIALTMILLKAGLGLDGSVLKKLSCVVARLAIMPCVTETASAALAAHFLLHVPWVWGLLLGSVLSAVSPAVVVPTLLSLKERGYGENKGISTLVIAASSVDDIIAISLFGVILGMLSPKDDIMDHLIKGPIEVAIGITVGLIWGIIAACVPHRNEDYVVAKRSFMVGVGGLVAVLGSKHIKYAGSGPLATIILSFLASLCWKWQGWSSEYNPVADVFGNAWKCIQPLLFGLIGTEIRFEKIDLELLGSAFAILFFGLFIRVITCCVVLLGANLNAKEMIFVNLAWLPKATVQAALGPVALDYVNRDIITGGNVQRYAIDVLTIAVLSILVTAPIGAIGISIGGPRLLTKTDVIKKYKTERNNDGVIENQL